MVGTPSSEQLNNLKQDVIQWDAKSNRVTLVDSSGNIIDSSNPIPVESGESISKDLIGNGKITVGTTPIEIQFNQETKIIMITADIDNVGVLFIGKSNVDSSGNNSIGYLLAGENITLSYNDVDNPLFVVSDTTNQNYWSGALV